MNDNETRLTQNIREQYIEKQPTKFDKLQSIDKKVNLPAQIFAYTFGIAAALVLGAGMCLAMKVIGDAMAAGIVIGAIGILMASVNYPIYKAVLKSRRKKYAKQVIELSEDLLNNRD